MFLENMQLQRKTTLWAITSPMYLRLWREPLSEVSVLGKVNYLKPFYLAIHKIIKNNKIYPLKEYFSNPNNKIYSKNFWNKSYTFFSITYNNNDSKILLIEDKEIINENAKARNLFNSYLELAIKSIYLFN